MQNNKRIYTSMAWYPYIDSISGDENECLTARGRMNSVATPPAPAPVAARALLAKLSSPRGVEGIYSDHVLCARCGHALRQPGLLTNLVDHDQHGGLARIFAGSLEVRNLQQQQQQSQATRGQTHHKTVWPNKLARNQNRTM